MIASALHNISRETFAAASLKVKKKGTASTLQIWFYVPLIVHNGKLNTHSEF